MNMLNRRNFLYSSAAVALSTSVSALEPINRINPRIKGVSLAAYSLRSQMRWMKGKQKDGNMGIMEFLDYSAREQFDAVELTAYFFPPTASKSFMNSVKRRAHILGLDISGGAIGNNFCLTPGTEEAKVQSLYTKKWIDLYADLGAPVIRVFAGKNGPKGATEEQVMSNLKYNLSEALTYAEKRGVILGMENHDSMTNIDKLLNFAKTVDSPNFGITFDTANIAKTLNPYAELEKLAPYTVNAQIKARIPINGELQDADFKRIIKILKSANYGGYVVLEYEEKENPLTEVPKYKKLLKSLI
ncbi:MAG: sugar phosphate isomerase/epimerase [Lentisphaeraceae bacterium]|nr:sugar phosphate isomerase/epimerase [Lentisphaeraceae bacterium]